MNLKIDKLYSEIIDINSKKKNKNKKKLVIFSNITCNPLKEYLNYLFDINKINFEVFIADYNNLLSENKIIKNSDFILVIWDLINLSDTFDVDAPIINQNKSNELYKNFENKLNLFLQKNENKKVYFTTFNYFLYDDLNNINIKKLTKKLNELLEKLEQKKLLNLISLSKIFEKLSKDESISYRDYYSSKMIYNIKYYKYFSIIFFEIFFKNFVSKKKLIILDCDNTLWNGILVEDGINNLKLSSDDPVGSIFYRVQNFLLSIKKKGILLALCTKNNLIDVKNVLKKKTILKLNDFVAIKANWNDKVTNIKEIARELNLGLGSFVFVDDSDFEINHVKHSLPEVNTIKVPVDEIYNYPKFLEKEIGKIIDLSNSSKEDANKTKMYLTENKRLKQKMKFKTVTDYINSLGIEIKISKFRSEFLIRASQMFKKTNQFHSSLKRLDENEIKKLLIDKKNQIYLGEVSDKFGNSGITLLMHVFYDLKSEITIDSFIMSCRVFGRNLEYVFLNSILKKQDKTYKKCKINFHQGPKNFLVKDFLKDFGFLEKKKNKFVMDLSKLKENKKYKIKCKWKIN